jgi:hypothetical protein
VSKKTIKQKQKEIIKLLKKELPKHGFFISEKSFWDNYNAKTGKWKKA